MPDARAAASGFVSCAAAASSGIDSTPSCGSVDLWSAAAGRFFAEGVTPPRPVRLSLVAGAAGGSATSRSTASSMASSSAASSETTLSV